MPRSSVADVIYVHGLWLNGKESLVLRRRLLRSLGCRVHVFQYASVAAPMNEITQRLAHLVSGVAPETLHFIGHSLGGLVIYRFLESYPQNVPGRVVFLGTPAIASAAAVEASRRISVARSMLGRAVGDELLNANERHWKFPQQLGVIAGTRRVGLGQFVANFAEDNDGSVAVSETRMPGASGHITIPVSHMGMLLSANVAREAALFLREGRFSQSTS